MGKDLTELDKEALVGIVKLCQKLGMKGEKGNWKEFLSTFDRKFGTSVSDPAKRPVDILVTFLQSFTRPEDLKFLSKIMRRIKNLKSIESMVRDLQGSESPRQRLVSMTVGHQKYIRYYSFPSHEEGWIIVPLRKVSKLARVDSMISIDCEMVLCQDGTEAVVRVCAVDHDLEVKLDKVVNPNKPIADYRTSISGIRPEDLVGVTCSLEDVQKALKKLLSHGTILVGHSLHNDLTALKIDHARVIDTSFIFKCLDMPQLTIPSLNSLCKSILGAPVRKDGDPHDCRRDAEAAMQLVLAKIERGIDYPVAVEIKVPNPDFPALLLHGIPRRVNHEELLRLFSEKLKVEVQKEVRLRGRTYTTYAVFQNQKAAAKSFKKLRGQETSDCGGRPQKEVSLELSSGETVRFYVRKMSPNSAATPTAESEIMVSVNGEEAKRRRVDL
ncbi:small RNA degrading nuclease 1-like [Wolffia australiana]